MNQDAHPPQSRNRLEMCGVSWSGRPLQPATERKRAKKRRATGADMSIGPPYRRAFTRTHNNRRTQTQFVGNTKALCETAGNETEHVSWDAKRK